MLLLSSLKSLCFFIKKETNDYFYINFIMRLLVILSVILSFVLFKSFAQEIIDKDKEGEITIDKITDILEDKYSVNIFYQPQWFTEITFSIEIADLSLSEAIDKISEDAGLNAVFVDDIITLVPKEANSFNRQMLAEDTEVVGDPSEYGRYSHATLSGIVKDGTTAETLIGVVIYDPESKNGVTTDVNGSFEIELPVGEHSLEISYIGYEELVKDIRLVSDGSLTIELFYESTQLDEVTIYSRRAQDNVTGTQMSRIYMDAKSLDVLPTSFGELDIVRSMTLLPGVQSVGEFGTGFNVRGGSADQNLILLENVPLFNSSHLFGFISVINPEMVNSVSLMKAGIPAKYGERASSVMEITLDNGLEKEEATISGGIGLVNSNILFETPIVKEKATFALGGRTSYSDWLLRRLPDEDLMNSSAGFYDITGQTSVAVNKKNYITLFGYYSFDKFSFDDQHNYEYSNNLASLRWNRNINDNLSTTLVLGWSNYQYEIEEKPETNPLIHSKVKSDIDYKSLKYNFSYHPNRDNKINFGINAIRYDISPGNMSPIGEESIIEEKNMETEQAYELSAYISDDISIGERISLELGLRFTQYLQMGPATVNIYEENQALTEDNITEVLYFDENEIASDYNGLEPRIGFRYKTGEASSVKLSYNRVNQYINLLSNTSVMSPTDLWKLSDKYIKPLRSDQYAIGYFQNFRDNTIETSLEAYYRDFKNAIEYQSGAEILMNDILEEDVINAIGYGYGLEFYVKKNSGKLTGWASYTFSSSMRRSQEAFPENQINQNAYFPSNYDRPHNLVVNFNYNISRRWRFGAVFTYSTGRPVTLPEMTYSHGDHYLVYFSDRNEHRFPDYHRLDISISLGENLKLNQRGKGSWTFALMNVYGRKNPYSLFYERSSTNNFNFYQLYIIGRPFPTLTYNYSF